MLAPYEYILWDERERIEFGEFIFFFEHGFAIWSQCAIYLSIYFSVIGADGRLFQIGLRESLYDAILYDTDRFFRYGSVAVRHQRPRSLWKAFLFLGFSMSHSLAGTRLLICVEPRFMSIVESVDRAFSFSRLARNRLPHAIREGRRDLWGWREAWVWMRLFLAVEETLLISIWSWHMVLSIYYGMFASGNRNNSRLKFAQISNYPGTWPQDSWIPHTITFTRQLRWCCRYAIFCPFTL